MVFKKTIVYYNVAIEDAESLMLSKVFGRFFSPVRSIPSASSREPSYRYKKQLEAAGSNKLFEDKELKLSRESVRVYLNSHYMDSTTCQRLLSKTTAVSLSGDREGFFQDGTPFPGDPDFLPICNRATLVDYRQKSV